GARDGSGLRSWRGRFAWRESGGGSWIAKLPHSVSEDAIGVDRVYATSLRSSGGGDILRPQFHDQRLIASCPMSQPSLPLSPFRKTVAAHARIAEELPLIHTSRAENLSSLANSNSIEPGFCDVFHESLVYLFYGRPAYRSKKGTRFGEPNKLCPVCF